MCLVGPLPGSVVWLPRIASQQRLGCMVQLSTVPGSVVRLSCAAVLFVVRLSLPPSFQSAVGFRLFYLFCFFVTSSGPHAIACRPFSNPASSIQLRRVSVHSFIPYRSSQQSHFDALQVFMVHRLSPHFIVQHRTPPCVSAEPASLCEMVLPYEFECFLLSRAM